MKPALLLDVDGVINAYPMQRNPIPPYVVHPDIYGYNITVHPDWSEWLNKLVGPDGPYELVWATTWEERAEEWIVPLLGLPTGADVIHFRLMGYQGMTHKLPGMIQWYKANPSRPSVWVDDCIYQDARDYIDERDRTGPPSRYIQANADTGLVHNDIATLWYLAADGLAP